MSLFKPTDYNECNEAEIRCGNYTKCFNTNGSFYCQCERGFHNIKNSVNFTAVDGQCQGEQGNVMTSYDREVHTVGKSKASLWPVVI